jgi:hypothetical protein
LVAEKVDGKFNEFNGSPKWSFRTIMLNNVFLKVNVKMIDCNFAGFTITIGFKIEI